MFYSKSFNMIFFLLNVLSLFYFLRSTFPSNQIYTLKLRIQTKSLQITGFDTSIDICSNSLPFLLLGNNKYASVHSLECKVPKHSI